MSTSGTTFSHLAAMFFMQNIRNVFFSDCTIRSARPSACGWSGATLVINHTIIKHVVKFTPKLCPLIGHDFGGSTKVY